MRRVWASLGSLLFFVIAPGTVVGLVPWWITRWQTNPALNNSQSARSIGAVMIVIGLYPLLSSFARFAWDGLGTPAPIAPPTRLVVTGFYRHVRNPIYVALFVILSGEAIFFADMRVFVWALLFWAFTHVVVIAYEEPTLRGMFGAQFEAYCANVPRWLARRRAWSPN